MSKNYTVTVDNQYRFEHTIDDVQGLDILKKNKSTYHLIHNNKSVTIEIITVNLNEKYIKVKVNNKDFNILINNDLDILINDMGFALTNNGSIDSIQAPMPGLILDIHVKEQQEVKENDALMILEAMKMENIIVSPRDGVIKSIHVRKGEAVNKNELLIEFD